MGQFLIQTLPKFFGAPTEDSFELLNNCKEKLSNFGMVESHIVDYTTYYLDRVVRQWWRGYLELKQV